MNSFRPSLSSACSGGAAMIIAPIHPRSTLFLYFTLMINTINGFYRDSRHCNLQGQDPVGMSTMSAAFAGHLLK